jgi:FixJ family two-component response regulator
VVNLVVKGKKNKQIALLLGVSPQAIDSHRAKAMARLQVDSVAALIRLVLESRIVSVDRQA